MFSVLLVFAAVTSRFNNGRCTTAYMFLIFAAVNLKIYQECLTVANMFLWSLQWFSFDFICIEDTLQYAFWSLR